MTLGEKIVKERGRLGLTQQALADRCQITKRTVASYETDGRMPHPSTLRILARELGCSTSYLTDDSITEPQAPTDEDIYISNVREVYGDTTADEIEGLLRRSAALFAGGRLAQEAKDKYYQALTNAYLACQREA